jgi:hypothetical protein
MLRNAFTARRKNVPYLKSRVPGLCCLIAASPAIATAEEGGRSIQVGVALGAAANRDIDNLNDSLESRGYPTFDTAYGTFGGLVRLRFDRLMIGAEGHGFRSETKSAGNYDFSLNGGYGILEAGYDIFSAAGFRIFPIIGIGGGTTTLHITESNTPSFDEILADPGRESQVTSSSVIVHAAIAAEYYWRVTAKSGLVVGLQAGYNRTVYNDGWRLDRGNRDGGRSVSGGPDVDFTGPAMNVNVGWLFDL